MSPWLLFFVIITFGEPPRGAVMLLESHAQCEEQRTLVLAVPGAQAACYQLVGGA